MLLLLLCVLLVEILACPQGSNSHSLCCRVFLVSAQQNKDQNNRPGHLYIAQSLCVSTPYMPASTSPLFTLVSLQNIKTCTCLHQGSVLRQSCSLPLHPYSISTHTLNPSLCLPRPNLCPVFHSAHIYMLNYMRYLSSTG